MRIKDRFPLNAKCGEKFAALQRKKSTHPCLGIAKYVGTFWMAIWCEMGALAGVYPDAQMKNGPEGPLDGSQNAIRKGW